MALIFLQYQELINHLGPISLQKSKLLLYLPMKLYWTAQVSHKNRLLYICLCYIINYLLFFPCFILSVVLLALFFTSLPFTHFFSFPAVFSIVIVPFFPFLIFSSLFSSICLIFFLLSSVLLSTLLIQHYSIFVCISCFSFYNTCHMLRGTNNVLSIC